MVEAPGAGRVVARRYRILSALGRGGMGVVWLAKDELIDRQVALKELRAPAELSASEREIFTMRVLSEARNAARVHHPNAVALYDVIPASAGDEAAYLVMELVKAPSLAEVIARDGKLPEQRVVAIARQLLDVLDTAHALGVVHRDVKPANILLAPGDTVKLTDFGIARTMTDARLTRTNVVVGTPAYLAPELLQGGRIEPSADLWSVGATLFLAVDGRAPFERQNTPATLNAILFEPIPLPGCGQPLRNAIAALLVRDPAQRVGSSQVRSILDGIAGPPPQQQAAPGPTIPDPAFNRQTVPAYPGAVPNWPHPPFPPGPPADRPRTSTPKVLTSVIAVVVVAGLLALASLLAYRSGNNGRDEGSSSSSSSPLTSLSSPAPSDTPTPDTPTSDTPAPSSDTASPDAPVFDPESMDSSSTDQTPLTVEALLPNSFVDSKGVAYHLVSGGKESCIEPDMTSNVQRELGDNGCTVSMTGQYLASGPNVTSTSDILVSVQIFPLDSAATAVQVYDSLQAESTWDFGIFCTRTGDGTEPCKGDYHQARRYQYMATQHRYLIEATALYTDLTTDSGALPWVQAAAYRADEVCGPVYYIENQ